MSLVNEIVQRPLPTTEYFQEVAEKKQIYLHHTAGSSNPYGVVDDWRADTRGRIATCIVIGRDGTIVQAFSSKFWAYHLGVKSSTFVSYKIPYINLDKFSIGIELCNWGQLTKGKDGKYYNYVNKEIPPSEVIAFKQPFKGFYFFQKYTPQQIENTRRLLVYFNETYNIPIKYSPDIWQITPRALRGEPGLFTHNSVRADKVDIFPQPDFIEMLKTL